MHQGIGQQEHRDSHSSAYIHIWMDHNRAQRGYSTAQHSMHERRRLLHTRFKSKKAFRVQTGSSHTPLQCYWKFVGILYVYTASQSIWLLDWELALSDVETMCL